MKRLFGWCLLVTGLFSVLSILGLVLIPISASTFRSVSILSMAVVVFWGLPNGLYYTWVVFKQRAYPWAVNYLELLASDQGKALSRGDKFLLLFAWPPALISVSALSFGGLFLFLTLFNQRSLTNSLSAGFSGMLVGLISANLTFIPPMLAFGLIRVGLIHLPPPAPPRPSEPIKSAQKSLWIFSGVGLLILLVTGNDTAACLTALILLGYVLFILVALRQHLFAQDRRNAILVVLLSLGSGIFGLVKGIYLYVNR